MVFFWGGRLGGKSLTQIVGEFTGKCKRKSCKNFKFIVCQNSLKELLLKKSIMPNKGDKFVVVLKNTHLGWGTYRKTNSREKIVGESYLPIPKKEAVKFSITNKDDKSRSNIYTFSTSDGFLNNLELKASGSRKKGCKYAKNLHGNGNLKLLTPWFLHINACKGSKIEIEFLSSTEIKLTKI